MNYGQVFDCMSQGSWAVGPRAGWQIRRGSSVQSTKELSGSKIETFCPCSASRNFFYESKSCF